MKFADIAKRLETISAINITPFDLETKEINWERLEENVQFLLKHGVTSIVPCGNTGEFYSLSLEEAKEEIRRVVDVVAGRALVVAGIGYSLPIALELGEYAQQVGADAVMIHQPIHPYVTESGASSYFRKIIETLEIPSVIYYKDPYLSDNVLKELAPLDKLVAVKYAINDLPRFARTVRDIPKEHHITWVCGTAEKWAPFFYHAGAKGFTSGLVNVYPEKSFAMLEALQNGQEEQVWSIWEELEAFENLRAKYNNGNNVVVIKEAMAQLGMSAGMTREPVNPLNEQDSKEVQSILESWGLLKKPAVS
ncbi:dihydrodipicolinate synthase family protein [Bacillus horti]|uniref:4-hydroxy-tetrahydrodipicolinate synthase n=1 Tax=Caldalkalibacillus horti TaxID=77523 RepID=A0ABT9VVG3_9BACI|nr:dihydrodipicolinate synthase family protein [Bacillus horti]MDQ0164983.1 4-hydroxy-tetrahydrodipicolinate synthase [Bacillus horti]